MYAVVSHNLHFGSNYTVIAGITTLILLLRKVCERSNGKQKCWRLLTVGKGPKNAGKRKGGEEGKYEGKPCSQTFKYYLTANSLQ